MLGDNGTGKSTLIKLITQGKHPAVRFGRFVKYAYYDQENANLNMDNTVLAELWERHVNWEQTKVRSILAQAGLPAEDMDKRVRMLSGGERAKLAFAIFSCENANVLILDEPTNHLDLPARESLESALKAFDGTILFVSHDRYFIRSLADSIIELDAGQLQSFTGDYETFAEQKAQLKAEQKAAQDAAKRNPAPTEKPTYRNKQARAEDAKRQTRIKQIEKQIAELEAEEESLNSQLALPEVTANFALLSEKCNRLEEIKAQTDRLYEEYETLI